MTIKSRFIIFTLLLILTTSCLSNNNVSNQQNKNYLDDLKVENNLKVTMKGTPISIVGKETKVGDTLKNIPLTSNVKLEDIDILQDKKIKVIYTAPSLDTKVCSLQTRMLDDAAKKYPNINFYSITNDTPFAQERFCNANKVHSIKTVSDYKYHEFAKQNGLLIKELGLITRALIIVDENNVVKYIEYVKEETNEANVDKALKFLEKLNK